MVGRELREGCLIPTIGGGLCQLSNALYDLALKCSCEIIERHAHTAVVPGSQAEYGRDATIFWNYVDFRFRPRQSLLIRAVVSKDELLVSFWGKHAIVSISEATPQSRRSVSLNTCTDCSEVKCFRHVSPIPMRRKRSAFLIEECWPEFEEFVRAKKLSQDELFLPFHSHFVRPGRYNWNTNGFSNIVSATSVTAMNSLKTRLDRGGEHKIASQLVGSETLAEYYSRRLSIDVSHVHVAQTLLPFLWRRGDLGGA